MRISVAERVFRAIRDAQLVRAGDRLGVAVSGGGDSVALLLLLLELRERLGVVLSVVHVNHKLRGRASEGDEKFAARLAAEHQLVFHAHHVDAAAEARRSKINLEDAARRVRYAYFAQLAANGAVTRIATAHTADDQAETVLAHLLRGTGIAGLAGIHRVCGEVIRPLLSVRRAELRAYLKSRKQAWREDATNRDTGRTRARIRRKLIPLLEEQFQPAAVPHLAALAERAQENAALLAALSREAVRLFAKPEGGRICIPIENLLRPWNLSPLEATRALSAEMVQELAARVKSRAGQLTGTHIDAVLQLAQRGESGKSLPLPGGASVRREHDVLAFFSTASVREKSLASATSRGFEHRIALPETETQIVVPQLQCVFRFRVIDWPAERRDTNLTGAVLDRDRLSFPLVLRNWRPGDRLHPQGREHSRKLKRLLSEARIGGWQREAWPVLASGGTLAWARGFPVPAEFAAKETTQAAVVITEDPIR